MPRRGAGQRDGKPALPEWSASVALHRWTRSGIDAVVLSIFSFDVYFGDRHAAIELASTGNDEAGTVLADRPDRFGFAASLPLPDVGDAVAGPERASTELTADAISLSTDFDGLEVSDPTAEPVLKVLDSLDAVVLIHPTSPPCWEHLSQGRPES